jgi:Transposase Tn5 dimerisation domain
VDRTLTTVASVILALGRLGGHMNRPSDGMPGWITLWRGMQALRLMVKGAEIERRLNTYTDIQYKDTS